MSGLGAGQNHFLDLCDITAVELRRALDMAVAIKSRRRKGVSATHRPLAGKVLAMIFDKPSTRTRVSFDVGMRELGGETIMLSGAEMQLGRGETIADTARVLSRYVDAIITISTNLRATPPCPLSTASPSSRTHARSWRM